MLTCLELAKLKPPSARYRGTPQRLAPVTGRPSDKITMAALYPRYAAFLSAGDTVVLETGSTSLGLPPGPTERRQSGGAGPLGINRVGDAGRVRHRGC